MKKLRTRLAVSHETIRSLTTVRMYQVAGGKAATDGATDCQSEAGGCETYGWSCINQSCTTSSTVRTTGC